MKIIFLDVDGVLNCRDSKSKCGGFIGIDNDKVKRLKMIVDATDARIVLVSSWKSGWDYQDRESQDMCANYLDKKLAREHLCIQSKTDDNGENRGAGIVKYLAKWRDIDKWIVLDDDVFPDYEENGIMPHLVKTTFYGDMNTGGLQDIHVDAAIWLLTYEPRVSATFSDGKRDYCASR